jgi:UDP-N-acetylmuramoyl-tripeptide--D-alanyl-D-alanine ligase
VTFGVDVGDVRATHLTLDAELRPSFTLETPWGRADVRLEARGAHQAANAAAAAAAALALGVDLAAVAQGLRVAVSSPWRMEVHRTPAGALVLNDAYNANPASAEAGLRALAAVPGAGRRVAVLGPMLELGTTSRHEHHRVAAVATDLGLEVIAVATDEYGVEPQPDLDAALGAVAPLHAADAVLVKASRAAGLERLAARLAAGEADASRPAPAAAEGPQGAAAW